MDSSEVVYSKTERSVWMSFCTLYMAGLSCWFITVGLWIQTFFLLPWAILLPCLFNPLTIGVTGVNLEAQLGFGYLKKTIPLAEIKSVKAVDIPLGNRKQLWLCLNSRAVQIIHHDDEVLQLGSTEPEKIASFIEK
ncbi:MAG: hypothetical protein VYC32_14325 [Planctomycetota bacterium]|nr:hypothetical protein [Planctomycetota bacterium]